MKNTKIWSYLLIAILVLQALAETLTVAIILQLDMLPGKFIVVLVAVMVLLLALTGALMFVRLKGKVGLARKIVACVLTILVVGSCAVISKYVSEAYKTVTGVVEPIETNAHNMYVLVLNDDPAKKLSDTKGYTFGVIENYDADHVKQMATLIEQETGSVLQITGYDQSATLVDNLYNGNVRALIMNGASIALLIEEEKYEDFFEKARILYTIAYDDLEGKENTTMETANKDENVTNTPFVVYISGSDTRNNKLTVSRSDVNILMVVNPVTKQVLLVNTPRDYYVPNPAGDGMLDKLTHCGLYGVDCSMEALEGLYNTKVNYYGQINFNGFKTLIDAVGGVTIYSEQSFQARHTYIKKGENILNGTQALDYARERYNVSGGDNGRGKNQMKVIKAVIEKMTTGTTIISKYSAIMESLEGMFSTNLKTTDISMLVKMQLSDMANWDILSFAVTGKGGSEKTYSAPGVFAYVMHPDEDVVKYAGELIGKVLDGEILTEENMKMPK